MMVRLNTRHELPQIGIRQTQGRLEESSIIQPQISGTNRQASSNQGATQPPHVSINSYPSRRAYGHRTMGDLMTEQSSRGISDVKSATTAHTKKAWTKATNAAKRGDDVVQEIKAEVFGNYGARAVFYYSAVPNPQIQGHPGQVVGTPDRGNISVDIETAPSARIRYTPGSVETYMKNEGFIRHWVSYGNYDISA